MTKSHILDIRSRGTKGEDLFNLFLQKLTVLLDSNLDDFNERISTTKVQLFIDGEEFMILHNSNLEITGITKF